MPFMCILASASFLIPFTCFQAVNCSFPPQSGTLHSLYSKAFCCFLSYVQFLLCYLWLPYPSATPFHSEVPGGQSKSKVLDICMATDLAHIFGQNTATNSYFHIFTEQIGQPRWKLKIPIFCFLKMAPNISSSETFFICPPLGSLLLPLASLAQGTSWHMTSASFFRLWVASLHHNSFQSSDGTAYLPRPYGEHHMGICSTSNSSCLKQDNPLLCLCCCLSRKHNHLLKLETLI